MPDIEAHIELAGTTHPVGVLRRHPARGGETVTFESADAWLANEGRFSIVRFYERRARRILPALLALIAAVLAAAAWLYLPGDFENVPKSALAATLFASNLLFFHETGYFQIGADTLRAKLEALAQRHGDRFKPRPGWDAAELRSS